MRILFFPSDYGGGFGHISRCLALAHVAKLRGHDCAFILNDKKFEKHIGETFPVYVSQSHSKSSQLVFRLMKMVFNQKKSAAPLFTEISNLDYQVVRDGLVNADIIKAKLSHYLEIVSRLRPDIIIADTNLLAMILAKPAGIPIVQIVRYASHPDTAKLIWWKNGEPEMTPPNSAMLFNPLLAQRGLPPINTATELLHGDQYIVPSLPEIEPVPQNNNTYHVGELTVPTREEKPPEWFAEIDRTKPLVYVTIGGGAGHVGNVLFFSTIIEAFTGKNIQVIVSTSNKFDASDLPKPPSNIKFFKWVPGKLMIAAADLVVFHGGYGTMMETISCGKPSIVLPFHTEQEGNGRRLEQLGCSRIMKLSNEGYKRVEAKWSFGTFNYLIQNRFDLTAEKLYQMVYRILTDDIFYENVKKLQSQTNKYHGPNTCIDLIERNFA